MNCKPTYKGVRYNSLEELKSSVLTPQKKQIQELYTQYLQSLNKSDTNPILQDKPSVITSNDKIIWGHPAIGKTTMLETNLNAFIDWDNEFNRKRDNWIANKSNTVIGTPEYKQARNEYMINYNNHEDYIAFVTDEWNKTKTKANKENKILIASPHMLLNLFPNDFDKVITMHDKTFMDRAVKRSGGDEVNSKLWKEGINQTLKSVDKSKIIETDKYLSDLFDNTKQEQVKKFVELQERLNNKEFVEGTKNVYDNSKELQELGTQEQYVDFIAKVALGIVRNPSSGEFNNSKVTDVVYHGTGKYNEEEILLNGFDSTLQGENKVIFFTGDINQSFSRLGGTINAIVNIEQLFNNRFTSLLNKANENSNSFYYPTEEDVNSSLYEIIKKRNPGNIFIDNYGKTAEVTVISSDQIHILSSKQDTEGFKQHVSTIDDMSENNKDTYYQKVTDTVSPFEQMSKTDQVAFEKTVRDLAARMSDRIGIPYKIINDANAKYKGKLSNGTAYINLAYCDMSSAIHEILGHPIIKSIKNTNLKLYQNLLKELETGKGEEILNRVKRDYVRKFSTFNYESLQQEEKENIYYNWYYDWIASFENEDENEDEREYQYPSNAEKEAAFNKYIEDKSFSGEYTLEEQQEEAIVELMSLMIADKLDKVKDKNLISLLKQLLKEMKQFIRALLSQREINVENLPDNMTINDLSDLLAYSNNKLILPGYMVEYTTPDDIKFKTYQEASHHISSLVKNVKEVDLDTPLIFKNKNPKNKNGDIITSPFDIKKIKYIEFSKDADEFVGDIYITFEDNTKKTVFSEEISKEEYKFLSENRYNTVYNSLSDFISINKEYEQSKEIIEAWKKVNNIQYNPEEVYSRGRKFYHKVGAFVTAFDPILMMQNYLAYIEDYERVGAELVINGFTRTPDSRVSFENSNIENSGDLRIIIYPTSEDIKWVSRRDAMSGTTRQGGKNVSEIFGKKRNELVGIGETKAPRLANLKYIEPSLAQAVNAENKWKESFKGTYNEIGLRLTGNNFRFEYDIDTPYQQKKMADTLNRLLDSKFGKIQEPVLYNNPIEPKITDETLKESIESVSSRIERNASATDYMMVEPYYETSPITDEIEFIGYRIEDYSNTLPKELDKMYNTEQEAQKVIDDFKKKYPKKEYTEQALINTKIVALKEVAKKYPRSLIRSEVKKIEDTTLSYEDYEDDMFQKLPSVSPFEEFQKSLDKPDTNPVLTGNLKPDIILPIGTSGSGKSTWIKSVNTDNQFVVISPDDMRVEFTGDMNNKSKDDEIYQAVTDRAIQAVKEGKQVIVDTTNLKKERRRPFIDAVKKALPNSIIQYKLLPLNPELAKQRIKADIEAGVNRANVPDSTIDKHAKSYNDMLEDIKSEDISNYDYKEEQAKKFNELQEKLQDETFLEAVKSVFDNSSKLQQFAYETFLPDEDTSMKLSSKEEALSLYIDYVAKIALGIIRNPSSGEYNDSSKVTDILHHGVTRGEIKDFDKFSDINQSSGTWGKGYYFAPTSNKFFVNAPIEKYVIVNSKKVITEKEHKTLFEEYKKRGFQGTVGLADTDNMFKEVREKYDTIDARERELIVFNPDQIHILDSKTDIEGFEKYIFNKSKQRPVVKTKDTVDNLPLNNIQPEEIEDIAEADNSPISVTPKKEVIQLPKTAQLILPIGISGSGKSTWINSLDKDKYTIISPDEIRKELTGDVSDNSRNIEIFKIVDDRILEALKKGDKVILDATNLNTTFRRLMITNLKSLYPKLDIRYKLLDVDPNIAKQRIANDISNKVDRSKTPDEIIDLQYQQYLQSKLDIKDEPIYEFNNERTAITDLLDRYSKNDNNLRKLTNIAAISGKTQNISNVPIVKDTDNINESIVTMAKYGRTVRELLAIYPSLTEHFKSINLDTKLSDYIKQQEIEKQVIEYVEAIKQDMADNFSDYEDYLSNINIYTIDDLYNYPNEKLLNDLCINGNLSK